MAMTMKQNRAGQLRRPVARRVVFQELAQEKRLAPQPLRARVVREEIPQLVAKDGRAARLEHDDRQAGVDVRTDLLENALEVQLGAIEEPKVIERSPATEMAFRHADAEA